MYRWVIFGSLLLAACGDGTEPGLDAGFADRGVEGLDAAVTLDASVEVDGEVDGGPLDLGEPDDIGGLDLGADLGGGTDTGIDLDLGADAGMDLGLDASADAGSMEDFTQPGAFSVESIDFTASMVPVSCRAPVGRSNAPAVLVSHGFFISHLQYTALASHLASWGLVACSVDYAESLSGNHAGSAAEIRDVFDAVSAGSVPALSGRVDPTEIALLGHSLGGKLSFLVASARANAAAVVAFDPVDSAPALCSAQNCPSAIDQLPIDMPVLVLGEIADEVRTSVIAPACNPADENFDDFYAASGPNTREVVLAGASHMSFVDDIAACGTVCSVCQPETAPAAELRATIRWFTTAFLLQNLEDRTELEPALTGAEAQSRFVDTGRVSLRNK